MNKFKPFSEMLHLFSAFFVLERDVIGPLSETARKVCWLVLYCVIAINVLTDAHADGCQSDLAQEEPIRCHLFAEYKSVGSNHVDDRILSRIAIGSQQGAAVRSFALVIGIDSYPHFQLAQDRELSPAKNDVTNLVSFLRDQQFDEIIVLKNADATKENIDYFLDVYLNKQLDIFGPTGRVLIAHTGHGGPGSSAAQPGNIILSAADGPRDYAHVYSMADMVPKLKNLASKSFHFVALFGSCYSGGIFASQSPGGSNDWYPKAPGAHAVSSTPHDDLAYALGDAKGSIFFDSLIEGVRSGQGDLLSAGWIAGSDGDLHRIGGGIVRLGSLMSFISGKIDELGVNPATGSPFPQVLIGSLSNSDHNGAFFFIGSAKDAKVEVSRNGKNYTLATLDTGSALLNNSDVKVFSAPDSYQVTGIDVSHFNETIDWPLVARAGYDFSYMKATESVTLKDARFSRNWASTKEAGLKRGAYHVFDYCEDIDKQFQNIKETVPRDAESLPVALDLVWFHGPQNQTQKQCADIGNARARILKLNALIEKYYGKTPIIFANQSGLSDLINDDFIHYPIWLQFHGDQKTSPLDNLKMNGNNPWTIWQHSSKGSVPGIKGNVDLDVFFGNKESFELYVKGGNGNPALQATRQ